MLPHDTATLKDNIK